jgi:RHS repeat-associated protein
VTQSSLTDPVADRKRPRRSRCVRRGVTYLNNRHYNPSVGLFVSVDPLVTQTGQPYIYGSANRVTPSDPSGLASTGSF